MGQVLEIDAAFPPKLRNLFEPYSYKVLWGGRSGSKSWAIARALLLECAQRPMRVLCAREQQNSIADSVHKVLSDQIRLMGLSAIYEIQQSSIRVVSGPGTGSEFSFEGIRHNIDRIRSFEGVERCWVEEAANVSRNSWNILIPTVMRKDDSQIWISFNPVLESDETYKRFVLNPPPNSLVLEVNWRDNPWFPAKLREDMKYLRTTNYDEYLHVYEGKCKTVLEGAVYADELRDAAKERITYVPYDPLVGVSTVWDLGWGDSTAIWFVQRVAFETRFIGFYENSRQTIEHYLLECQQRGYTFDTFWLPHDAKAKSLGTGRSIEEIIRAKGHKVRIVPKLSLADGINAARTVFPNVYFDKERCSEGLQALRHYRYELVEDPIRKTFTRQPVHDWTSHAADAFRYAAIAVRQPSNTISRVANALLAAADAEQSLFARLSRFGHDSRSSTSWMK